ncbi:MAG: VUT family protein [Thermoprotei archaeon]|nr:MAG: VUT family protein [Thermoprotei archaeon]
MGETRSRFSERDVLILTIFSSIFGASIVFANIAAGIKLVEFMGLIVPAGTIAYSITFPITDIIDEVYGKRKAVYIVWGGLAAELVMLLLIGLDSLLPPLDSSQQMLFARVFSPQLRIVTGSIIAYLISQHHDVWAFWKWREVTKGRFLWLRNNASTMVSQLIDTGLFTFIAFYAVYPLEVILNMVFSMWLFKILIAALDTPFVYLGVLFINKYVRSASSSQIINDEFIERWIKSGEVIQHGNH